MSDQWEAILTVLAWMPALLFLVLLRFHCALGWHRWRTTELTPGGSAIRRCKNCAQVQERSFLWDGSWFWKEFTR